MDEITRIAQQTKFGGASVLDGADSKSIYGKPANNGSKGGKTTLQVGANKGDEISFSVNNMKFNVIVSRALGNATNDGYANNKLQLSKADGAKAAIELMDKMIADVDSQRSGLGAIQNRLESSIRNQSNVIARHY